MDGITQARKNERFFSPEIVRRNEQWQNISIQLKAAIASCFRPVYVGVCQLHYQRREKKRKE